jgi:hypothetical protein
MDSSMLFSSQREFQRDYLNTRSLEYITNVFGFYFDILLGEGYWMTHPLAILKLN